VCRLSLYVLGEWSGKYMHEISVGRQWTRSCRDVFDGKLLYHAVVFFFFCAANQRRSCSPPSWGFQITHKDASQSVGLLWTSDQLVAETSTWQHTTLTRDKHPCRRGIRTHDLSRRAAAHLRHRPRGHWDRHHAVMGQTKLPICLFRLDIQLVPKVRLEAMFNKYGRDNRTDTAL
jgi:hypothetical protein